MFVKVTNNQPSEFPYTIGQFRRDNPHTSFPKKIPDEIFRQYNVFAVKQADKPAFDFLVQDLVRDKMPHKNPFGGDVWLIGYTVENKPQEDAEANVRTERNRLLSETDWMALSDNTMTPEWAVYRQKLRDITSQGGFPYAVEWPTKPGE